MAKPHYYSHDQNWHDPRARGNDWDFEETSLRKYAEFLKEVVKPHVKELLTQYGPVGVMWFDTPQIISRDQSRKLVDLVRSLQPDCLVNHRAGHDMGDYREMADNQIPIQRITEPWETPGNMNGTWGYRRNDDDARWESAQRMLSILVDLISKGGNYLLNVGPTDTGVFPERSVVRLKEIGAWMRLHSQAVYATSPSPYPYEFEWGRMTCKEGKLYLFFFKWQNDLSVPGLNNTVSSAVLLSDPERELTLASREESGISVLDLHVPGARPDTPIPVVALDLDGRPCVDQQILQQADNSLCLPMHMAAIDKNGSDISLTLTGVTDHWTDAAPVLTWEFRLFTPCELEVHLIFIPDYQPDNPVYDPDSPLYDPNARRGCFNTHEIQVDVGQTSRARVLDRDYKAVFPRTKLQFPEAGCRLGRIRFDKEGIHRLSLRALYVNPEAPGGLSFCELKLNRRNR